MSPHSPAAEEDNWLKSYLASMEFPATTKTALAAPSEYSKKGENFNNGFLRKYCFNSKPSFRKSCSSIFETREEDRAGGGEGLREGEKEAGRGERVGGRGRQSSSTIVPMGEKEALPQRVNVIRDVTAVGEGHFVREHLKEEGERARPTVVVVVGQGGERYGGVGRKGRARRRSLDYDELDAVKERVRQVASQWNSKDNVAGSSLPEGAEEGFSTEILPSGCPVKLPGKFSSSSKVNTPKVKPPKSWSLLRWLSKSAPFASSR